MNMKNYPDDADGDALRRVVEGGSDMSKPMLVDFMIAVPDEKSGTSVSREAREHGYQTKVEQDRESGRWTCYCSKMMILTYEAVILTQDSLDEIARPFGGYSDGWGTFGNKDKAGQQTGRGERK